MSLFAIPNFCEHLETNKKDEMTALERRERVRCMQRVTWKLIIPYVKYSIASGNLLYDSRSSNRDSVINLEGMGREMGRKFRREGTWVYLWLILTDVWTETHKIL